MSPFPRLVILATAMILAPPPAVAGSQSSDSSSNCSNGRCTRVDRYTVEDRHGRRGWVREQRWREDGWRPPSLRGWEWHEPRSRGWRRWREDD
ncbi:hypothetical protein GXW77_06000 [Roseomonas alkaliterrae]|uniref:Secreted protein n=1 Tax=Neoroseomonas alkaliterrae TaxID=1452450 RepID=A0A840XJR1_9PROT|nr:hypothetical protein [Neoroseomonas alkaliterrae]MBB5688146.1 hypothetical protein [Neoroseomonas alkaliterrae]MBR0675727.1 hypothetical protein [Neoroseomonas alkaliterrae]